MTGYDPNNFRAAGQVPPGRSGLPADGSADQAPPGPLPPRIEPTWITHPVAPPPGQPVSAQPQSGLPLGAAPRSSPPLGAAPSLAGGPSQPAGEPADGVSWQPGAPPGAPPYQPSGGYPMPYSPPGPAYPGPSGQPAVAGPAMAGPPRRRLAWPGILALVLVLALAGLVVFQVRQIDRLDTELGRANDRASQAQTADDARLDALEGRAGELEKQAGKVFNPEEIATAVVPSVFRVAAGEFTGTAFAVGKATGGGTNLFTNFHVVESVWNGGGRQVRIERSGESYPARIVKVDEVNDVAQLSTTNKFTGLVMAPAAVKSGQQIVVVGAPLGLEDSVTTGVVSAFRNLEDGSGTVIQFSAPINPGNSGGPVINADKQVVGIATAKARDAEGIGLAVPIKTACDEFKIC